MKTAFSTLGCPGWSLEDICATAGDLGINAIELRGMQEEINILRSPYFTGDRLKATLAHIARSNLEVAMLTSGAILSDTRDSESHIAEARGYIDLAKRMGVKYVRVLATGSPESEQCDLSYTATIYGELCDYANSLGVSPLIETNGVFNDTQVMASFLKQVDRPNMGVLWDIHHPYRYNNESPEQTIANIGQWVKYVHLKDSKLIGGKVVYQMLGYGDVPYAKALKLLKSGGYEGYVSLEWVKRWLSDLEDPGIVFAHFANAIGEYL